MGTGDLKHTLHILQSEDTTKKDTVAFCSCLDGPHAKLTFSCLKSLYKKSFNFSFTWSWLVLEYMNVKLQSSYSGAGDSASFLWLPQQSCGRNKM